jgi:chromosome segregation ATPase
MSINDEIKARIFSTADRLFDESGREKYPTVDAVRRAAKTDMNAASSCMKEWRKLQTAQPEPVAVTVPETVSEAFSQALATAWTAAVNHANEALQDARRAWEIEREEADQQRAELAVAFDSQEQQLITAETDRDTARAEIQKLEENLQESQRINADQAAQITAQAHEIEQLKSELQRSQADTENLKTEIRELHAQIDTIKADSAAALQQLNTDKIKAEARADSEISALQHEIETLKKALQVETENLKNQLQIETEKAEKSARETIKLDTETRELRARLDAAAREVDKAEARADRFEKQLFEIARAAKTDKPTSRKTPAKKPAPAAPEADPKAEAKATLDAWSAEKSTEETDHE